MLELEGVSLRVGAETHLADVSLALEPGSLNLLLGPTLSGKTSLLRVMAGLDRPTSGRVLADGRDVTGLSVRRRDVAMVYQQFINYPSLTVRDNIASPLRVARRPRAEIEAAVARAAGLLKLEPYLDRRPGELSGGQQQRTALARALVKGARLVLLDEPLANLDYKLREELREELPRVFAGSGAVLVYATTEPTEALLLGGHTATLHEGRVTQFGPTPEVYRAPRDLRTARLFSDPPLNALAVALRGGAFEGGGARIPAPAHLAGLPEGRYTLAHRPHQLSLRPRGPAPVALRAEVGVTEITGSESFVHLRCAGEDWTLLEPGVHPLPPGAGVTVHLDASRLMAFDEAGRAAGHVPARAAA